MLKSPKNSNKKPANVAAPKLIAVIKNGLTEQEMDEAGERWVNHQGPYMTVVETLAYAAKRDKEVVPASIISDNNFVSITSVVSMTAYEVAYWTKRFNCTEAQLEDAMKAVGTIAVDLEKYLEK